MDLVRGWCQGAVFGLMGDDVALLLAAATIGPGITYYSARHESAAVSMADGHARSTGRLSICVISRGPGLTNAITGLIAAHKARSRLLLIVGDAPRTQAAVGRRNPKYVDQRRLLAATGLGVVDVDEPGTAASQMEAAALLASAGSVVVLNVPTDVLERPAGGVGARSRAAVAPAPSGSAPREVQALADMLRTCRRPLLVAGRGVVESGAAEAVLALAHRVGAFVGTTLPAKDLFRESPRSLGIIGGFAHDLTRDLAGEVDCLVGFGASLNAYTLGHGRLFPHAATAQVTTHPDSEGVLDPPDLVVQCDVRDALAQLVPALEGFSARPDGWQADDFDRVERYDRSVVLDERSGPDGLDPRALLSALDESLPADRAVVTDAGHFCGFAANHLQVPGPGRFCASLDFAAVGVGHGTALGFSIGTDAATTVYVVGDGGLLMSLGELDTAARYGLPLVVVVVNDAAYGAELHHLALAGVRDAARTAVFEQRDFAAIASAVGFEARVVTTVEEAREAGRLAHSLRRPLLLDCRVTREVRATWLEERLTPQGSLK